jgi:hypothetical protein
MRWVREVYPDEYPSDAALGRKLGVGRTAIGKLLDLEGTTSPSFETLLLSKDITGATVDQMTSKGPPAVPVQPK